MKTIISVAITLFATLNINAQLLYKISGNGLNKPSYIIGTHHLCDVKLIDKVPGVKEALEASEQVCGELVMSDMQNPDSVQKVKDAMMLPEGKTIKDVLSEEQMNKLNETLKSLIGVDMTNPMLARQMETLSPGALNSQISLLLYLLKHQGEFDPQNPFDAYFQKEAIANGKPVIAFETLEYQKNVLYKSKSMERQIEELMCTLENTEYYSIMLETLTEAYKAQDVKKMEEICNEKMNNSCDSRPEEDDILIFNRNNNWIKVMQKIMAEKATFFAVGAAHLLGEKGVLEQLKKTGYTVEGVSK